MGVVETRGHAPLRKGMTDEQEPTAAYYRKVSEEITQLAQKSQLPDVQRELLELAERFRRMADYVGKRYPNGRSTSVLRDQRNDT